ncbi:MAG: TerC family protein [Phycisphaerales bacterium]
MQHLFTIDNAIALLTLTSLEIVLGIDNIVFVAILTGKLPEHQRAKARVIGLGVAMLARIALLFTIKWLMGLTEPLFQWSALREARWSPYFIEFSPSLKDLILLAGGLFLIGKATIEIHHKIDGSESAAGCAPDPARGLATAKAAGKSFAGIILQILVIDLVFSVDSVITAVGMAESISIMVIAIVIAIAVMMVFSGRVSRFIEKHPTMKMLALAFLILIGVMLVADGVGEHIKRGYIYFAMAFALGVEVLNIRVSRRRAAHQGVVESGATS